MKKDSKIRLSKKEIRLLNEEDFFRNKKRVTEKIYQDLSRVAEQLQQLPSFTEISFPAGTDHTRGKISKGENYLGLPFIILDFPKKFAGQGVFAFRTMIWWGNFVSCTLLISGEQTLPARQRLLSNLSSLKKEKVYLCISRSPWHHHFGENNYMPLKSFTLAKAEKVFHQNDFLKLARKLPITKINKLHKFVEESFDVMSVVMINV